MEFILILITELNMMQQEIRNYIRDSERKRIGHRNNLTNCIKDIKRKHIGTSNNLTNHTKACRNKHIGPYPHEEFANLEIFQRDHLNKNIDKNNFNMRQQQIRTTALDNNLFAFENLASNQFPKLYKE